MDSLNLVLAYFGPETVMPLTSIIATIAALVVVFGKNLFLLVAYCIRRVTFRERHGRATTKPHLGARPAASTPHERSQGRS